ncbi:E2F-associated phosphoprotein isoform X2 [Phyllopteryx taeniolatus]|uniref:E2F-associated phosphoprotein isoform X2 n=1 Tax=Phyllopteryx taeniolatus TaxID=161469 RepID=UPI002AD28F83|nr:E2F-associated phosphoprotein isoform X2 [Phyllopteryx taeniolatus]
MVVEEEKGDDCCCLTFEHQGVSKNLPSTANKMNQCSDVDSYEIEEPSDEERAASSSEDELDVLLNGTPEQKKKLIREYLTGESESSSDDDFEKEMEAELSSTLRTLEDAWAPADAREGGSGGDGSTLANPAKPQMYDEIYFDSDSDEEVKPTFAGSSGGRQRLARRRVLTDDELLYDPDEDERDRAWVEARRWAYHGRRPAPCARSPQSRQKSLPSSDAILNCPACMTTLCLDCQRHEKYRTQYRAMFVMNCSVNKEEVLRYKTPAARTPRNRKRGKDETVAAPAGMDADELYHPVQCSECSTEVAVLDKDDVYHFFNILSSHC